MTGASFTPEAIMACGYVIFLGVVAGVLEMVAHHTHQRSQATPVIGFTYHPDLDHWKCPTGQTLHRVAADERLGVLRYQAEAHHCNACHAKHRCTDSDRGRVIERQPDSWIDSGLHRFHRGLSLVLLFLAQGILLIELLRQTGTRERLALVALWAACGAATLRLLISFFSRQRSEGSALTE